MHEIYFFRKYSRTPTRTSSYYSVLPVQPVSRAGSTGRRPRTLRSTYASTFAHNVYDFWGMCSDTHDTAPKSRRTLFPLGEESISPILPPDMPSDSMDRSTMALHPDSDRLSSINKMRSRIRQRTSLSSDSSFAALGSASMTSPPDLNHTSSVNCRPELRSPHNHSATARMAV